MQLQELHFTQMPVQTSIDGGVVTWTGTVIANHLYNAADDSLTTSLLSCRRRGIHGWISWLRVIRMGATRIIPRVP